MSDERLWFGVKLVIGLLCVAVVVGYFVVSGG